MKKFVFVLLAVLGFTIPAKAELSIDVSGAMRDPMPIAIPEMIHDGFFVGQQGNKIREVIKADLERSGLFQVINPRSYIQDLTSMSQEPEFIDWKAIKAQALVQSAIEETADNQIKVS
ncbi:MAG: Tol-Pal system protein TolB, partial [Alphaproteobacteria bacterium]|nr:Tol-Pal system protein TolB [Alphaproteobacteria bacterium]